jgi:N-acetylmuramoyl-L-alanine amidase
LYQFNCNANKNTAASGTETHVMVHDKTFQSEAAKHAENPVITLEKDYKRSMKGFDPNPLQKRLAFTMQEEYLDNSIL